MDSKAYFEKVMQDFNQFRNSLSLRKYCTDEGVDYHWLIKYKKEYPGREHESVGIDPAALNGSSDEINHIGDMDLDADYIKKRDALLARIAYAEQKYEEQTALAEKMKAKADALQKEREQKEQYIAEIKAEIARIKRNLGIIR